MISCHRYKLLFDINKKAREQTPAIDGARSLATTVVPRRARKIDPTFLSEYK
jgi:hypothetical protein